MTQELRLYAFVNYYLSPLQHGLQTAHVVSELYSKYKFMSSPEPLMIDEWADDHKTIIILNGGNSKMLQETFEFFGQHAPYLNLPYQKFHEDEQSLNGALTCVGIILPEKIFAAVPTDKVLSDVGVEYIWHKEENGSLVPTGLNSRECAIKRHISQFRLA